jgi:hypothetical protein
MVRAKIMAIMRASAYSLKMDLVAGASSKLWETSVEAFSRSVSEGSVGCGF